MKRFFCLLFSLAVCALAQAAPSPAQSSAAPAPQSPDSAAPAGSPAETVRRFVAAEMARSVPGLRAEISVGEIDSHLRLAPCERTEAFLRPGGRLWGRSFVGFRCLQHPAWSVSVPVMVRVFGPALVASQPLAALQPLSASAVRQEEVELSREPGGVVTAVTDLEDKVCTRSLEPGQPVPMNCLRMIPAVGQGEPVKLVGVGSGFSISTDGTSLATAAAGEIVRVRTESGHTVSGIARKGRIVEVSF